MKLGESCKGCTYLCTRDNGYSNYTVTDTDMHCLVKRNPHLPEEIPDEFSTHPETGRYDREDGVLRRHPVFDRWWATCNARCDMYTETLPDGSINTRDHTWHIDGDGDDIPKREAAAQAMTHNADPMPMLIRTYFREQDN